MFIKILEKDLGHTVEKKDWKTSNKISFVPCNFFFEWLIRIDTIEKAQMIWDAEGPCDANIEDPYRCHWLVLETKGSIIGTIKNFSKKIFEKRKIFIE